MTRLGWQSYATWKMDGEGILKRFGIKADLILFDPRVLRFKDFDLKI